MEFSIVQIENKKLLYIHAKGLNFYEDHQIFSLLDNYESYILVNNPSTGMLFHTYSKYINAEYKNIINDSLYYVSNLEDILLKIRPEVVVTKEIYSLASLQVHLFKKRFHFIHVILVYENTDINRSLWGLFPLTRFISILNRNSLFVSVSDLATKNLLKMNIKDENIIKTFTGLFPMECNKDVKEGSSFKILFIGNLYKNKGISTLIDAFSSLINEGYKDMYLYIAGKGDLANFVAEKAKEIENLIYLGYVDDSEKEKLLSDSDLFVYPSEDMYFFYIFQRWKEQGAWSVVEAMRCGLPVIASNSGSLPEILGRDDVIFSQGNSLELKNKILMLYKDRDLLKELKVYNTNRFSENFNIYKNANKIYEKIKGLLDQ